MHVIHYAGRSFVTGSDIAQALLRYALALARAGDAAVVELPVFASEGVRSTIEVLIGPGSQLAIQPADDAASASVDGVASDAPADEPVDPELVRSLIQLTRSVGTTARPIVAESP